MKKFSVVPRPKVKLTLLFFFKSLFFMAPFLPRRMIETWRGKIQPKKYRILKPLFQWIYKSIYMVIFKEKWHTKLMIYWCLIDILMFNKMMRHLTFADVAARGWGPVVTDILYRTSAFSSSSSFFFFIIGGGAINLIRGRIFSLALNCGPLWKKTQKNYIMEVTMITQLQMWIYLWKSELKLRFECMESSDVL